MTATVILLAEKGDAKALKNFGYSEKRVEFLWRKMHELCKTRLHRDFPAGNKNMISRFPHDIPLSR